METNNEITETPLIPPKAPKPKRLSLSLSVPKRNPKTGDLQSKGNTSPSIYTPNKPVPNYMKTTSHSCHDSCKYGLNHDFESKWTPPVRRNRRENEGIRGVVLNPEFRTGGKSKNRGVKEQGIEKQSTEQSEDLSEESSPVLKDIHEMEMIIPPVEKVFNLSDTSYERQNEISISNSDSNSNSNSKSKSNLGLSDSIYGGLSLNVVRSTSDEQPFENSNSDSDSNSKSNSKSNVESDSVYEGLSLNVVGSTSFEESGKTVPVIEPVPVDLVPIESVSIESVPTDEMDESNNVVKKKKNTGKQVIKNTGTSAGAGTGTALSKKKGEITKKKIERENVTDKASSLKPRKKDVVQKDRMGTDTVRPRVREIQSIDDTKKKKIKNTKVVEPPKVKRAAVVNPPAVRPVPVPTLKVRKFKKDLVGTATSSMENNPSENSNNSDHSTKEKTIYVVEPKAEPKKRYQKKSPSDVPVPKNEIKRRPKIINPVPKPPLPVPPHKMAFRRGKIINLQTENPVPVRIKFRRMRPSNESDKAGTNNKGMRKKREVGLFGMTPPSGTGTPAVVLRRHTGTVSKKSKAPASSLFNHVIEETASKLVEKRKSKVKALVGAFETVISLQEKSVVN